MQNSPTRPAKTWRRGQTVRICNVRNNHHGGIVRFSMTPVNVFNTRSWHKRLTLFHSCWETEKVNCKARGEPCGTDKKFAFCRYYKIPNVFPDGKYALGYVWYGGLHHSLKRGHFPDYYSCSFINIKGGKLDCNSKYWPKFVPGTGKKVVNGKCQTAANVIGKCGRFGCSKAPSKYDIPAAFKYGKRPKSYSCADVRAAMNAKSNDTRIFDGICKSKVCCASECKKCGGQNCRNMPGGEKNCCTDSILKSKRKCSKYPAPCIQD